ncbi:MAG: hypothetical protein RIT28_1848 [Pseudomonadota bacterium]
MSTPHPALVLALLPVVLTACADDVVYKINNTYVMDDEEPGAEDPDADLYAELPVAPTISADQLPLDVFGPEDNTWWLNVSESGVEKLNQPWTLGAADYVEYDPPREVSTENLLVVTPSGEVADYGEVGISLIEQLTSAPWTSSTIPSFRLDADEQVEGQRFGGLERVGLDSAGYGSMFGAASALAVFRALGLPAARTAYAWVGGSGWENDALLVPMLVREAYDGVFCEANAALLGGGCETLRTFNGEITNTLAVSQATCEVGDCGDDTNINALQKALKANFRTQSFDEKTEPYFDWTQFHRSTCAHWLLWIADDYVHQLNNVVLVEGLDGRFRLLPSPNDIVAGYAYGGIYNNTPLFSAAILSSGCNQDDSCREAQLDTCEQVINEFEAMDPVSLIDGLAERLRDAEAPWGEYPGGMWREPDDAAYEHHRSFYETRAASARAELETLRAAQAVNR